MTIGSGGDIILPINVTSVYRWGTADATAFVRTITSGVYNTSALPGDDVLKTENYLHIQSGNTASAITITTPNNNVGIGKTSPSYELDVNGVINATNLFVGGVVITNVVHPQVKFCIVLM